MCSEDMARYSSNDALEAATAATCGHAFAVCSICKVVGGGEGCNSIGEEGVGVDMCMCICVHRELSCVDVPCE